MLYLSLTSEKPNKYDSSQSSFPPKRSDAISFTTRRPFREKLTSLEVDLFSAIHFATLPTNQSMTPPEYNILQTAKCLLVRRSCVSPLSVAPALIKSPT